MRKTPWTCYYKLRRSLSWGKGSGEKRRDVGVRMGIIVPAHFYEGLILEALVRLIIVFLTKYLR